MTVVLLTPEVRFLKELILFWFVCVTDLFALFKLSSGISSMREMSFETSPIDLLRLGSRTNLAILKGIRPNLITSPSLTSIYLSGMNLQASHKLLSIMLYLLYPTFYGSNKWYYPSLKITLTSLSFLLKDIVSSNYCDAEGSSNFLGGYFT
jgi:hypothetical protein